MPQRPLALLKRFGPAALVLVAIVAAFASGITHHLSLHELRERRETILALDHIHPVLSVLAYVGLYILVVALSVPAALPMTVAGGLFFGPWIGGLAAAIGCTLGGTIVYLVCRTAAGDVLRRTAGARVAQIEDGVRRDAFFYILMLRLLPIMPFSLTTLALSAARTTARPGPRSGSAGSRGRLADQAIGDPQLPVGNRQHAVERGTFAVVRHAGAHRHAEAGVQAVPRVTLDADAQPVARRARVGEARTGKHQRELLATVAHGEFSLPAFATEKRAHLAQHIVTDLMREAVVDALEMVDVDQRDAERSLRIAQRKVLAQHEIEVTPVEKAGQRIDEHFRRQAHGLLDELAIRRLELARA